MDVVVYLLLILVVILILSTYYFYRLSRKYKKESVEIIANNDESLGLSLLSSNENYSYEYSRSNKKISDLALRLNVVYKLSKVIFWDYDVNNKTFIYSKDSVDNGVNKFEWSNYVEFVHPDDISIPQTAIKQFINGDYETQEVTYRLKFPGYNDYRWFNVIGVVYDRDADGNPLLISGLMWDITSNILEKLELEENKALLELSFTTSGLIPWELDLSNGKLSSTDCKSDVYDNIYTFDKYIDELVHPDHKDRFLEENLRLMRREADYINTTVKVINNGKYEWIHIVGRVIADDRTGKFKAVGTSQIITDTIEEQEELIRLRNKADESNKLKSTFLANMSHEIRSPLNAIVGFSNLIVEMSENEEIREYCRIIEINNNLLLQLVSDILDISKIEAGQMEFRFEKINVFEILSGIKTIYEHKMPKGVSFICEIPEQECILSTEKNRLVQVISNIINNAIKYTEKGSITLGYADEGEYFRIYIRDTGKGIAKDNIPKLFDRFSKFDSSVPGIGLGLSICETIVKKLGGHISVTSEQGEGSEFTFTINKNCA